MEEKEPSSAVQMYMEHNPPNVHEIPNALETLYKEAIDNFKKLHTNTLVKFAVRVTGNRGKSKYLETLQFASEDFQRLVSIRTPSKDVNDIKMALRFSILEAKDLLLSPPALVGLEAAHDEFKKKLPTITIEQILSNDSYNKLAAEYAALHWSIRDQTVGTKSAYSKLTTRNDANELLKQVSVKIQKSVIKGDKGASLLGPEETGEINLF